MKKYLYDYIKEIDEVINSKDKVSEELINKHLIKIKFFQHERLIHLLVTLFYTTFMLIFMGLGVIFLGFFIIGLILVAFVVCYIIHYFHLENGVQYLYVQYDKLVAKSKGKHLKIFKDKL